MVLFVYYMDIHKEKYVEFVVVLVYYMDISKEE